ncbi:MAG: hypothetical protein EOO41_01450 [Methanobacteriota archaeon]|nr:MAG: hypothetical protein EOO41_01450 [Euryarchaeota archaeon]
MLSARVSDDALLHVRSLTASLCTLGAAAPQADVIACIEAAFISRNHNLLSDTVISLLRRGCATTYEALLLSAVRLFSVCKPSAPARHSPAADAANSSSYVGRSSKGGHADRALQYAQSVVAFLEGAVRRKELTPLPAHVKLPQVLVYAHTASDTATKRRAGERVDTLTAHDASSTLTESNLYHAAAPLPWRTAELTDLLRIPRAHYVLLLQAAAKCRNPAAVAWIMERMHALGHPVTGSTLAFFFDASAAAAAQLQSTHGRVVPPVAVHRVMTPADFVALPQPSTAGAPSSMDYVRAMHAHKLRPIVYFSSASLHMLSCEAAAFEPSVHFGAPVPALASANVHDTLHDAMRRVMLARHGLPLSSVLAYAATLWCAHAYAPAAYALTALLKLVRPFELDTDILTDAARRCLAAGCGAHALPLYSLAISAGLTPSAAFVTALCRAAEQTGSADAAVCGMQVWMHAAYQARLAMSAEGGAALFRLLSRLLMAAPDADACAWAAACLSVLIASAHLPAADTLSMLLHQPHTSPFLTLLLLQWFARRSAVLPAVLAVPSRTLAHEDAVHTALELLFAASPAPGTGAPPAAAAALLGPCAASDASLLSPLHRAARGAPSGALALPQLRHSLETFLPLARAVYNVRQVVGALEAESARAGADMCPPLLAACAAQAVALTSVTAAEDMGGGSHGNSGVLLLPSHLPPRLVQDMAHSMAIAAWPDATIREFMRLWAHPPLHS